MYVCMYIHTHIYTHIHTHICTRNEIYLHTMDYDLAIKRNEVLIHATVWMNLENRCWVKEARLESHIVSDSVHMQKTPHCMVPRTRAIVGGGVTAKRHMFSFEGWRKFLILMVAMAAQFCEYTKSQWIVIFLFWDGVSLCHPGWSIMAQS